MNHTNIKAAEMSFEDLDAVSGGMTFGELNMYFAGQGLVKGAASGATDGIDGVVKGVGGSLSNHHQCT